MVQERRPGRPLKPLDPRLDPAVAAFAERVRAFYANMHVSLAQIGEALSCDASTLSRYFSGTTLPERGMLDRLYEAVDRFTPVPVHEDVRRSTHELFYAACSVKDKPTYELCILKDEKEAAEQRATHAEETADELQAELQAALEMKQLTEGRLRQLQADSPATALVAVNADILNTGDVMVEIEDSGVGMTPYSLDDANERLANPPFVDDAVSKTTGLYVIGRLASLHGIQVRLRRSGGGVTALVLVPGPLLTSGKGL